MDVRRLSTWLVLDARDLKKTAPVAELGDETDLKSVVRQGRTRSSWVGSTTLSTGIVPGFLRKTVVYE